MSWRLPHLRRSSFNHASKRLYLNVNDARRWLKEQGLFYSPLSVKQELNNLKNKKFLYDAGRGWYTTLSNSYPLNTEVISKQEKTIARAFHLLPFSIWSSRQIISHYQHLPTRYITFVYLEFKALSTVRDYLLGEGLPVYMNPHAPVVEKTLTWSKTPSFSDFGSRMNRPWVTLPPSKKFWWTFGLKRTSFTSWMNGNTKIFSGL